MTSPPVAIVSHSLKGRLRLRVPARRRDIAYFERLARRLAEVPGVTRVGVNPDTASILILYSGDQKVLLDQVEDLGLLTLARRKMATVPMSERIQRAAGEFDQQLHRAGGLDLASLTAFTMLVLAAVQVYRGQILAPAVTLVWHATEALRAARPNIATSAGMSEHNLE